MTSYSAKQFRLSPVDGTGWMFGLSLVQLLTVACGVALGTVVMVTVSVLPGVAIMVVLCGLGAARISGASLLESIPLGIRFMRSRARDEAVWLQPIPVLGGDPASPAPPALVGQELLVVDAAQVGLGAPGTQVAVSHDQHGDMIAASIRVSGRQFGLLERAEQDWLIEAWGNAIGSFVSERNPVVSVRWSQWAAPAGLDEHRAWVGEHLAAEPLTDVRAAYEALLREAGSQATRHEVLVTVTVAIGKVRRRRDESDRVSTAAEALLGEMRLFAQRLEGAGLIVSGVLSPSEWARAMRLRLDPSSRLVLDGRLRSLGDAAGGANPASAGPSVAVSEWNAWHTDGSWHRALHVTEWPRIDVEATWLSDLMLYAGSVRTMSVILEPVARSKSQRSIVRDAAKIESDAAHRSEKGFRVGAKHRRAKQAVEEREEELVAGYGEFVYAGLLCVTAPTLAELDDATEEVSQVAASLGVEVRPLHGRHDIAMVATLPVARGVVPKEWL